MKKIFILIIAGVLISTFSSFADDWYESEENTSNDYIKELTRTVIPLRPVRTIVVATLSQASSIATGRSLNKDNNPGLKKDIIDEDIFYKISNLSNRDDFKCERPVGAAGMRASVDNNESVLAAGPQDPDTVISVPCDPDKDKGF